MKASQYLEIIKNIKRDDVTDIDKGTAIMQMLEFATLNHVNKDELVEIIRYLFPFVFDWDGKECVPDTDVGEWKKYPEKTPHDGQEIIIYIKGKKFSQKGCAIYKAYSEGAVLVDFGEEPIEVEEGDEVYWIPFPIAPQQTGGNNMARNISYDGIGAVVATFQGTHEFESGTVVAVVADQTVSIPTQGEPFDGVIFDSEGTLSSVQIEGFVTVSANEKIQVGRRKLVIDAEDSVQEGEGNTYLVVASTEDTVTFLL